MENSDILGSYKGDVVITKEVEKDTGAKKTFDSLLIGKRVSERKIRVAEAPEGVVPKLMQDFGLDKGEAESIALVVKNADSLLATDDKSAIKACKLLNIDFTTAVGFVVRAYEKKLLPKDHALEKLTELAKYGRYSERIIEDARIIIIGGKNAKNAKRKD